MSGAETDWLKILEDWQTIIAAIIALIAVLLTIRKINQQLKLQREQIELQQTEIENNEQRLQDERRAREWAAISRLPDALSNICSYVEACTSYIFERRDTGFRPLIFSCKI